MTITVSLSTSATQASWDTEEMAISRVPDFSVPACLAAWTCHTMTVWVSGTSLISLGTALGVGRSGYKIGHVRRSLTDLSVFLSWSFPRQVNLQAIMVLCWLAGSLKVYVFLLICINFLFIVSHFCFKIPFHILVRDKSSASIERNFHLFIWWQKLTTDNYIKIPFKPQSFADHSLAVFLLLLGLKVL